MKVRKAVTGRVQQFLPGLLVAVVLVFGLGLFHRSIHTSSQMAQTVTRLSAEVSRLSQEQAMPTVVLARNRNSICYIYALYTLSPPPGTHRWQPLHTRVSGTGFVVAKGLIATNRHVVQPWFDDDDDEALIERGAVPKLQKLMAFFPDLPSPVELTDVHVSAGYDLAVARFPINMETAGLRPVPLASTPPIPGDAVVVVGYPMGVTAMLAKSPRKTYQRLAYQRETIEIARELAQHYLIRPSATYGHLGDVVEEKLIYDAPTAQGGSGGPVFDSKGEVIGINAAYIDGFAGGTLGVAVEALKPLIAQAEHHSSVATRQSPDTPRHSSAADTKAEANNGSATNAGAGELP